MRRLLLIILLVMLIESCAAQNDCGRIKPRCRKLGGYCSTKNECKGIFKPGRKYCQNRKCGCCIRNKDDCILDGVIYPNGWVFYRNCMKFSCENNKWISSNQYNALCKPCSVLNDPHFTTFDGLLFDWHGHSTYVLSQVDCEYCPTKFVYSKFDDCESGYAWATCVYKVYFQPEPGTFIEITKASPLNTSPITIDGGPAQNLAGVAPGDLIVLSDGVVNHPAFAWMAFGCIHVMGFMDEGYLVKICSGGTTIFAYFTMQDNLCGLCGNWDGDKYNDLRYRVGTIEPPPNQIGTSSSDRIVDASYGNDWEAPVCPGYTLNRTPYEYHSNPCSEDDELFKYYKKCNQLINELGGPKEFLYDCMFDQCIATKTRKKGLPEQWFDQTKMLIKEDIQQRKDTVIYPGDPTCNNPTKCQTPDGVEGKCSIDPIEGYVNYGTMQCEPHCKCWIQATCEPKCVNGGSVAHNSCICYKGWTGPRCETPLCEPCCDHGDCTAPFTCTCWPGWTGPLCEKPVLQEKPVELQMNGN